MDMEANTSYIIIVPVFVNAGVYYFTQEGFRFVLAYLHGNQLKESRKYLGDETMFGSDANIIGKTCIYFSV